MRGPGGGYRLARPSGELRIADIIVAVDEPIAATRCSPNGSKGCTKTGARCVTHDLWEELGQQIHVFLSSVSLADVVERRVLGRSRPCNDFDGNSVGSDGAQRISKRPDQHALLRSQCDVAAEARSPRGGERALALAGNPSSVHAGGRAARAMVEEAREAWRDWPGASPNL